MSCSKCDSCCPACCLCHADGYDAGLRAKPEFYELTDQDRELARKSAAKIRAYLEKYYSDTSITNVVETFIEAAIVEGMLKRGQ